MAVSCAEGALWGAGMECPPSHRAGFCISGEGGRRPCDERKLRCPVGGPRATLLESRERLAQGLIRRRAGGWPSGNPRDGRAVVVVAMIERIALIGPSLVL